MVARVLRRTSSRSSSRSAAGARASAKAAPAGAVLLLAAIVLSFSFIGCPCLNAPINASPALRWFLFSNFGASRICPEMLKRGMSLKLQEQQPALGRFFPMQCSYVVNDASQTVTVSFVGTGYGYMAPAKRVGFSCTGSVEYRPDFRLVDEDIYVWGRLNRTVQGPTFNLMYVENAVLDLATSLPGVGSIANFLGDQIVKGEMTRGFTVVSNEDKGNDFTLGILMPPYKPHHPFDVSNTERYTFANETVDIHQNQRDYLGPFEVAESGQALYMILGLQGPAVDLMIVDKPTGDAWRDAYQKGSLVGPPGGVIAGGPLQPGFNETRRYPLSPGLYYVVVDNTSTAGLVSPPMSLLNPLGDAVARLNYVAQLGE